jgi:hypothetical protein
LKPGPKPKTPICHPDRKHFGNGLCASCYNYPYTRKRAIRLLQEQPEIVRKKNALYARERGQRIKLAAFALLGGKCSQCDWTDARALEVDHINGRLPEEKKKRGSHDLYSRILTGKRSIEDLQLLCANHHRIKTLENNEHPRKY